MKIKLIGLISLIGSISPIGSAAAQTADSSRLALHADVHLFFTDNEYSANRVDGYTLPGFTLRPYVEWHVDPAVTLQAGMHWLHYWGHAGFPHGPVNDVLSLASDSLDAVHLLPWMQATVAFTPGLRLVVGSLVNTDGHGLPYPLYNPERLYATDPEAGVQLLADWRHLKADLWCNWRNFIWYRSATQEVFDIGMSLRPTLPLGGDWTLAVPLHLLVQHHGGEGLADTNLGHVNHSNAAAGLAFSRCHNGLRLAAEGYAMLYSRSGEPENPLVYDEWGCLRSEPVNFKQGWSAYALLKADWRSTVAEVSYWTGERFVPLLGPLHFSNVSANTPHMTHDRIRVLTLRASHAWHWPHSSLTLHGAFHYYFPYTGDRTDYWKCYMPDATMFSLGCMLDLHPSLTLIR